MPDSPSTAFDFEKHTRDIIHHFYVTVHTYSPIALIGALLERLAGYAIS